MSKIINYEVCGINPKSRKAKTLGGNFKSKADANAMRASMKAVGFVRTYIKKSVLW